MDFSAGGEVLQSNCAAYERLLWDAGTGRLLVGDQRDQIWATYTSRVGFEVMGIWPEDAGDGSNINAVCRDPHDELLATVDDLGLLSLYRWPCAVQGQGKTTHRGHASHVTDVDFAADGSRIVTVGSHDRTALQWRIDGRESTTTTTTGARATTTTTTTTNSGGPVALSTEQLRSRYGPPTGVPPPSSSPQVHSVGGNQWAMGLAGLRDALREGNRRGASSEEVANLLLERAGVGVATALARGGGGTGGGPSSQASMKAGVAKRMAELRRDLAAGLRRAGIGGNERDATVITKTGKVWGPLDETGIRFGWKDAKEKEEEEKEEDDDDGDDESDDETSEEGAV